MRKERPVKPHLRLKSDGSIEVIDMGQDFFDAIEKAHKRLDKKFRRQARADARIREQNIFVGSHA